MDERLRVPLARNRLAASERPLSRHLGRPYRATSAGNCLRRLRRAAPSSPAACLVAGAIALGAMACESGQQRPASPANAQRSPSTTDTYGYGDSQKDPPVATPQRLGASPGPSSAHDPAATTAANAIDPSASGATQAMPDLPATSGLSDGQIAAMIATFNEAAIQQAQLAELRALSPAVKRFAQHMISAHRTMQSRDAIVLSRSKITPTDNAVSNQLKTDAQDQLSTLQSVHGRDFDLQYVDGQVRDHDEALKLLVQVTPIATSPDLRTDLRAARFQVEDQLQMARKVLEQLGTTPP